MRAKRKPEVRMDAPWQLRMLEDDTARKAAGAAVANAPAQDRGAAKAEHASFFLPRFVRVPDGSEWS